MAGLLLIGAGVAAWQFSRMDVSDRGLVREATAKQILDHVQDLKAPLVLVNFWASWCEPCKLEFPHILKLRKTFADKGLQVVFVSVDDPSDLSAAEKFLRENQVDFKTFYKGKQSLKFVSEIYPNWSGAVPTTVLIGPGGKIVDAWEGDTSGEEFQTKIQPHLKGS